MIKSGSAAGRRETFLSRILLYVNMTRRSIVDRAMKRLSVAACNGRRSRCVGDVKLLLAVNVMSDWTV